MTDAWPTGSFDVLRKDLVVVFCGLNPSIEAAATGHNFGSASNRFWRTLHLAGFSPYLIAAEYDRALLRFGCGVTAAVGRPTRSAGEVGRAEFRQSAEAFERKITHYRPHTIGAARAWVLPNPSGLNRAFTLDRLVEHYGGLRADVAQRLARFASGA
jgi:TDG/mug DNA glycosylase family protein